MLRWQHRVVVNQPVEPIAAWPADKTSNLAQLLGVEGATRSQIIKQRPLWRVLIDMNCSYYKRDEGLIGLDLQKHQKNLRLAAAE
jgi:hypothetical protein